MSSKLEKQKIVSFFTQMRNTHVTICMIENKCCNCLFKKEKKNIIIVEFRSECYFFFFLFLSSSSFILITNF